MNAISLKPLALTFALGGAWNIIAGIVYIFVIGTRQSINNIIYKNTQQ